MNLKYYLRGLGLGIVITAVIMGSATGGKKEVLTNEEIIARAKSLGMVENKVLTEYEEDRQKEKGAEKAEDSDAAPKADAEIVNEPDKAETEAADEEVSGEYPEDEPAGEVKEEEETKDITEEKGNAEPTIFSVNRGESTHEVSKRLAEIGLVSSADEFKTYLKENRYDRKIVAAKYEIPANADEEVIARIITGEKIPVVEKVN